MSYCGDYFSQADVSQRQSILVKNMQYMRENKRVSVCPYSSLSLVSSSLIRFRWQKKGSNLSEIRGDSNYSANVSCY